MNFLKNKRNGFTLVEALLAVSILIFIFLSATAVQISSEVFLKNIRTDFEKHLELNNALDHIVKNVRRSRYFGGFPRSPNPQILILDIEGIPGIERYFQSGDEIRCNFETNPVLARDARVIFRVDGPSVTIQIIEDLDPGEGDKIPIILISKVYARDK